jgi:RNA polymerase sigma factor for flagellar operon FliA
MSSFLGTTSSSAAIDRPSASGKAFARGKPQKRSPLPSPPFVDDAERNDFILNFMPSVHYIAYRVGPARLGPISLEGLVNAGVIGLIDALEKFDPQKNVKFKTYAQHRIRGAMLDELRALDLVSRTMRTMSNKIEKVRQRLAHKNLRAAEDAEIARAMRLPLEKYYEALNESQSKLIIDSDYVNDTLPPSTDQGPSGQYATDAWGDPFRMCVKKEGREILAQAINELPPKERTVITLYYYEEFTLKEIGEVIGFTESRVCQYRGQAVRRLQPKLRKLLQGSHC